MRIWLLAENWPPRVGGIENYLTHIAAELAAQHEVTVIAPLGSLVDIGQGDSYTVITRRFFWPLIKPAWLPLYWWAKKQASPDVIICGKGLFEGQLAKKLGVSYFVCTYAMEIKVWMQRRITKHRLTAVLSQARGVLYINDVTRDELLAANITQEQLIKMPPGVDERFFNTLKTPLITSTLDHYGIRQPYILSVGRLIERKGFLNLIEAFSKLDQTRFGQYQLVIVGQGPQLDALRSAATDYMVTTSVKFLTNVPDKHLPALYQGAKLFALTPHETATDMEGFGIVYLEAAASGIPAVATKTGGAKEAVINAETGLVVPSHNVQAITDALTRLLEDTDMQAKIGADALKHAEQARWSQAITPLQAALKQVKN